METQNHLHKKTDAWLIVLSAFVVISLAIGIILIASVILVLEKAI